MAKEYHVYILSNATRVLYIGMTAELGRRVWEHRTKRQPESFTARYNVSWLVYVETFTDVLGAIAREKQLKGWRRERKIASIERENPEWCDLAKDWDS